MPGLWGLGFRGGAVDIGVQHVGVGGERVLKCLEGTE